jgi:hypothetical protein
MRLSMPELSTELIIELARPVLISDLEVVVELKPIVSDD